MSIYIYTFKIYFYLKILIYYIFFLNIVLTYLISTSCYGIVDIVRDKCHTNITVLDYGVPVNIWVLVFSAFDQPKV